MFMVMPSSFASVTPSVSGTVLDQVHELEKKGNYLEAQKLYEEILKSPELSVQQLRQAREGYEGLNWKLLFSRIETPHSTFHKVVTGDSLYRLAGKYHTTVGLIKRTNGLKSDTIYPKMNLKINTGVFSIHIDKSENILSVSSEGKPIKTYRVATGEGNGTPTGEFKITDKLVNPTWYHAGAIVPPDSKDNILGTRWLGFDYPGYGIHGTTMPDSIGKQVTAGCVRMFNEEVEELYDLIPSGTKVTIVD